MGRCPSCDAILTKRDRACYKCGEPTSPGSTATDKFFSLLTTLTLMVFLAGALYFVLAHELPSIRH